MTSSKDELTRRASSFGGSASAYTEHRPGYPDAAVEWLLAPIADRQEPHILDLGAGTGKLTESLISRGYRVTAVEPDEQMAAELRRLLPEVPVLAGRSEAIPLPAGEVDAVLVGQAFHWFDPALALPEIARVLTPGGVLGALWNADDDRVEWVAGYKDAARSRLSLQRLDERHRRLPAHPAYTAYEGREFGNAQRRTADSLTATAATHSHLLVMPEVERAAVLADIRAYLASRPETAQGEFDLPMVTLVERCVRLPHPA
jgi:SAM-dependent methyltransferase